MREMDPLKFLKAVMMNADLPLSVRMRAAIEVMPFMHPKLAVTAQVTDHGLAELLDRRLRRMEQMKNGKIIDAVPKQVEAKPPLPRLPDRRFRRV